jgi:hypothetical protein
VKISPENDIITPLPIGSNRFHVEHPFGSLLSCPEVIHNDIDAYIETDERNKLAGVLAGQSPLNIAFLQCI